MTQKYEVCAPDGICRLARYPVERVAYSPHGLKYVTFNVGDIIDASDLDPLTQIDALVAGGHLRPVSASDAKIEQEPEPEEII